MVIDALRGYLQLASGLTEVSRERARAAARAVVAQAGILGEGPGDTPAQIRRLADELGRTARGNRDLLLGMVHVEAERAAAAVGFAGVDDVAALKLQVERLSRRVDELAGVRTRTRAPARKSAPSRAPTKAAASKTNASRSSASKAAANKTSARKSTARKSAPSKSTARKTAASKASAGRTSASKAAASNSIGRKTSGRKTTGRSTSASTSARRSS